MKNEMVMASAGSGKTYRLSNRLVSLLMRGVEPSQMMALTFTKKAAGEFAAAVFEKIASAAASPTGAQRLSQGLDCAASQEDYLATLQKLVASFPRLTLGTLDSFFARLVQSYQAELGLASSSLQLLEGGELQLMREEILGSLLNSPDHLNQKVSREFFQAFKAVQYGKEEVPVRQRLHQFIEDWHAVFLDHFMTGAWGQVDWLLPTGAFTPWKEHQAEHCEAWKECAALLDLPQKRQQDGVDQWTAQLESYLGGAGQLSDKKGFFAKLLEAKADFLAGLPTTIRYYKPIAFCAEASRRVGALLQALAEEELRLYAQRSHALWTVLCHYEAHYDLRARQAGRVTFEDIKYFLARIQHPEQSQLAQELLYYRLDGRINHWLLDEFQDTSQAQWAGLEPLLDEVVQTTEADRSLFVVGDVKQSIYQWRGGRVELFDHLQARYDIEPQFMQHSWRSQKPVLALVNTIFGHHAAMKQCFGPAADRWEQHWQEHHQAGGLPVQSAYAEVRVVADAEEREAWLRTTFAQLSPIQRGLSCALLVRSNEEVRRYAQLLREMGYPVAEEGKVCPATDNALGGLLLDLLRWLLDPSDRFARQHLEMSPLSAHYLVGTDFWGEAHHDIESLGLTVFLTRLFSPLELSGFSALRFDLLLRQIDLLTAQGKSRLDTCLPLLEQYTLSVPEGSGVIEVMTIHQSKGLGFDLVILPEISRSKLVNRKHFEKTLLSHGPHRTLLLPPASWVCSFFPPLAEAESQWASSQLYESFCLLYVALTRAKRGLYCLLEESQGQKEQPESYAHWITLAVQAASDHPPAESTDVGSDPVLYAAGTPDWYQSNPLHHSEETPGTLDPPEMTTSPRPLSLPTRRRRTQATPEPRQYQPERQAALNRGLLLHRALQEVEWLAAGQFPSFPPETAGELDPLFQKEEIHALFRKPAGPSALYREQAVEYLNNEGEWASIVIDRFWTHSEGGKDLITILDYKTDQTRSLSQLAGAYEPQLREYEAALRTVYPAEVEVRLILLSLSHRELFIF